MLCAGTAVREDLAAVISVEWWLLVVVSRADLVI
jgi:hypothetical protein